MTQPTLSVIDMLEQVRVQLQAHASVLLHAVADAVVGQARPIPPSRRSVTVPPKPALDASPLEHSTYCRSRWRNLVAIATYREAMAHFVEAHRRYERDRAFATRWFGAYADRLQTAWQSHGVAITAATTTYERHRLLYGTRHVAPQLSRDPAAPDYQPARDWTARQAALAEPTPLDVPARSADAAFLLPTLRDALAVAVQQVDAETHAARRELIEIKAEQLFVRYVRLARATFPRSVFEHAESLFAPVGTWLIRQWGRGASKNEIAAAYCYAVYVDTLLDADEQGIGNPAFTLASMINDSPLTATSASKSKREQFLQYLETKDFRHAEGDRRLDRSTDVPAMYLEPDGDEGKPQGIVHSSLLGLEPVTCLVCYARVIDRTTGCVDLRTAKGKRYYRELGGTDWTLEPTPYRGWVAVASQCDCTLDLHVPTAFRRREEAEAALRHAPAATPA